MNLHNKIKYIVALIMGATIIISCKDNSIEKAKGVDILSTPTEEIKDLKLIHTENGVIRNEITTKLARRYQHTDTLYYVFPEKVHARSFTPEGELESELVADSAVYRQSPDFFEGYINVVVTNLIKNQRLETDTLFWNVAEKRIYTTAPSLIIRPPDTIPALEGFESDDKFQDPIIRKVRNAQIYVNMTADSTAVSDTLAIQPMSVDTIQDK